MIAEDLFDYADGHGTQIKLSKRPCDFHIIYMLERNEVK